MIKHANIIYIRDFSELGGVETFTYEMVKKYHNLDIAVVYKTAHISQLRKVAKVCPAYQHTGEPIECDVAIINYDISIIPYISESADIYQVIHGDYENEAYKWKPPTHPRIKAYIGITKHIVESFRRITGIENVILSYNPLTIIENKPIMLISGTRLSKIKGKDRMVKLVQELDKRKINYKWIIFTNDLEAIESPNVYYEKPTSDFTKWLNFADYLVQLSDTEACSYSINEALYRNIPVIVTPLPYLKEIGVEDGKNAYIMEFDCSNISSIVDRIENVPKFEFKHLEDNYGKLLAKSKSKYKQQNYVICTKQFDDMLQKKNVKVGDIIFCTKERAKQLVEGGVAEYD